MEIMENSDLERFSAEYKNVSQRFIKQRKDFSKQYCSIYRVRLNQMKEFLKERIEKKWGTEYPVCELHKLSESDYSKCIVIGTLFKDQKLKPSVLKQLAESNSLVPQPIYTHFTDESDKLFIEDDLQRYQVLGCITKEQLVTGVTCALLGTDQENGKFLVEEYCFADFRPYIDLPISEGDAYVVFISGLDLVHIEKSVASLRLFVNWVSGLLGDVKDIAVAKIVRLVIAGNSTRTVHEKTKLTMSLASKTTELPEVIESVKLLDTLLLDLAQFIEVDVMPGEHDPSNHILPQQPMHHCMFPKAMEYKSLSQVSNPYECEIGGVRVLGSSGQPIADIMAFSDIPEPIDVLEHCLKWSHLAPTAPDTLGCYPFYESDPFIIEKCPHVMFVGNQNKFNTKMCTGDGGQTVRLICIPEFANTFTVAVLNLKNLECMPVTFKRY